VTADRPRSGSHGGISRGGPRSSRAYDLSPDNEPTPDTIRAARRQWVSGVAILTTVDQEAEPIRFRGATVSSFTVVSLDPPIVLACLEIGSTTNELVSRSERFAVSILGQRQTVMADRFAGLGPIPDGRFTGVPYDLAVTGSPIISNSLAWFDCELRDALEAGDHLIVTGDVVAAGVAPDEEDEPLVNYDGSYRQLALD
jgi:flavin reductase (DIM6/NTAB) family NADH-FMN oxidoreductase RutF